MSKLDQIKANALATRAAKNARSNPFEDAARGRDPAPKISGARKGGDDVRETSGLIAREPPQPGVKTARAKFDCPVCAARRQARAAAQKKWRQKEQKK